MMPVTCPPQIPEEPKTVIVQDVYSGTIEKEKFRDLPDNIKFKDRLFNCNGEKVVRPVPVALIRTTSFDADGRLTTREKAVTALIEYLDKDGYVLETLKLKTGK